MNIQSQINTRQCLNIKIILMSLPGFKKFCDMNYISPNIIEKAAGQMQLLRVKKGDYIFKEGEKSNYFYGIIRGNVSIRVNVKEKYSEFGEVIIEEIEKVAIHEGDCFGESGLVFDCVRTASAYALTDCILFTIDYQFFSKNFKVRFTFKRNQFYIEKIRKRNS